MRYEETSSAQVMQPSDSAETAEYAVIATKRNTINFFIFVDDGVKMNATVRWMFIYLRTEGCRCVEGRPYL